MKVLPGSVLLLLLCLPVLLEAKRQGKPLQPPSSPPPAKRARGRSVPGSGELTTKEGHRCTWQTSGEGLVTLQVNCSTETPRDSRRYWCRYAGKPDLCQAYSLKSSQYWKQLVGKLKKKQNACDGEKILKAKTCKKAPAEAHMKLAQHSGEEEKKAGKRKGASRSGEEKRRKKDGQLERAPEAEHGLMSDAPAQSYCGQGWNSLCSFFAKIFEG
ncbi:fibroblast growth factor-binding protein 2 isoform X2 [Synchiropus splendidus]|nr:fibroblast growth factor-binding protein 2 isoform X2 [Synchiropus splendidus]